MHEEAEDTPLVQPYLANCGGDCSRPDSFNTCSTPSEKHNSEREGSCERVDAVNGTQHRTGEEERAQGISDTVPNTLANPHKHASPITAVGFDIETTGIESDDILTVACVWSPTVKVTCFHGDDFKPLLDILDAATLIHTFNGIEFDLIRLAKHCGRSSIGSWVQKTVDPHYLIRYGMGFGGCMRLNELLIANGFEPKSGSGLQAIQFWNDGNLDALSSYCMDDARLTYELCETRSIVWGNHWTIHLWEPRVMRFAGVV
jgi:hypothetical protein